MARIEMELVLNHLKQFGILEFGGVLNTKGPRGGRLERLKISDRFWAFTEKSTLDGELSRVDQLEALYGIAARSRADIQVLTWMHLICTFLGGRDKVPDSMDLELAAKTLLSFERFHDELEKKDRQSVKMGMGINRHE